MPVIQKENRVQNYPGSIIAASLQDLAAIPEEGWTVGGAPIIVETPFGKGMQFDGAADYVSIGMNNLKNINVVNGTISIVFSPLSFPIATATDFLVDIEGFIQPNIYNDGANTICRVILNDGLTKLITGTTALVLNRWYMLTQAWDGINMRLYLNGVQEGGTLATGSPNIDSQNRNQNIAASFIPNQYANVIIYSTTIWPTALSLADIVDLYNNLIGLGTNP